jgi:uncharacterized protein YndB with AHSA1/START domain
VPALPTVSRSVVINAKIGQVWDVLTIPRLIAEWANTFQPGMYAESAWLEGCEVHWKSAQGEVLLTGRVVQAKRGRLLKIVFNDELNPSAPAGAVSFSETYTLEPEADALRLTLTAGPMPEQEFQILDGRWAKALDTIRQLAEAGGAARMGQRPRPSVEPARPAHG